MIHLLWFFKFEHFQHCSRSDSLGHGDLSVAVFFTKENKNTNFLFKEFLGSTNNF